MFMDFMVPNYRYTQIHFNVFPFLTCVVKYYVTRNSIVHNHVPTLNESVKIWLISTKH